MVNLSPKVMRSSKQGQGETKPYLDKQSRKAQSKVISHTEYHKFQRPSCFFFMFQRLFWFGCCELSIQQRLFRSKLSWACLSHHSSCLSSVLWGRVTYCQKSCVLFLSMASTSHLCMAWFEVNVFPKSVSSCLVSKQEKSHTMALIPQPPTHHSHKTFSLGTGRVCRPIPGYTFQKFPTWFRHLSHSYQKESDQ